MGTVALLLLSSLPRSEPLRDDCDLVEVNHFYDEQGRLVFDQVIFYDWSDSAARYQVRAWRLVKSPDQLPRRDLSGYYVLWKDDQTLRRVHAKVTRETWTQWDPELAEREILPKEQRRELAKSLPVQPRQRP